MFKYQEIEYKILSRGKSRWTNFGNVTKVFAVNTTTGLGGRYFDLNSKDKPFRFSPD